MSALPHDSKESSTSQKDQSPIWDTPTTNLINQDLKDKQDEHTGIRMEISKLEKQSSKIDEEIWNIRQMKKLVEGETATVGENTEHWLKKYNIPSVIIWCVGFPGTQHYVYNPGNDGYIVTHTKTNCDIKDYAWQREWNYAHVMKLVAPLDLFS